MAYLTLDQATDYMKVVNSSDDLIIQGLIGAAQIQIEHRCHRRFEVTNANETRYFNQDSLLEWNTPRHVTYSWDQVLLANTARVLWLDDDLVSVSTLTNGDGTIIPSSNYFLMPRNRPPYQYIRLKSTTAWVINIDLEIQVTGAFGYSLTADAGIQNAMKELVAYYYRLRDAPVFDVIQLPSGAIQVPKGWPVNVEQILVEGGYVRPIVFA